MAPLKIGIIGAGFSGTSLSAMIHLLATRPLEIFLFDKTGCFGAGIAYSTSAPFHLLNVRASDMSAIETNKGHFVDWFNQNTAARKYLDNVEEIKDQFLPRLLYGEYLKELLTEIGSANKIALKLIPSEVTSLIPIKNRMKLITAVEKPMVDKVILALGNSLPSAPSFPISSKNNYIGNPWKQGAFKQIEKEDTVVLLGSGLSMIDSALSLHHQQHKGKIFSISRHGLLPLPHTNKIAPYIFSGELPVNLLQLMKLLRFKSKIWMAKEGDWRSVLNAFREHIPHLWGKLSSTDKQRFLRHGLAHWNIHRHRVPRAAMDLLLQLQRSQQLSILSGRILAFKDGTLAIKRRGSNEVASLQAKWIINCMGPSLDMGRTQDSLVQSLIKQELASFDPQNLGFKVASSGALIDAHGNSSSSLYALGSPCKGVLWESVAVPEIRKQALGLAKRIIDGL